MVKSATALMVVATLLLALGVPGDAAAQTVVKKKDPLWNGILIGAAVGGAVGFAVAPRVFCDLPDSECEAIVKVVIGLPAIGIGIGVGALADSLHHQRAIGAVPSKLPRSLNLTFRF
jgi:hypothetical protein